LIGWQDQANLPSGSRIISECPVVELPSQAELRRAISDEDFVQVRALAERYGAWDVDLTIQHGIPAEDLLSFQHDYRVEFLRARYGSPPSMMLLGTDAGFPAACGAVDLSHPPHAEIKTLYVAPEARGRGLGSQIMHRLMAEAKSQGFSEVRLETVSFMTDAIRLYRSFGFAERPAYYAIPDSLKPITVFMARTI
jgi:ribosomal protein S18 acetylase RimI-like enzyme